MSTQWDGGLTVAYQSADRKRSIAWYSQVLGFELLYDVEKIGWCEMKTHLAGVSVGFSEVQTPKVQGGPTLTWGVADLDATRSRFEELGVRFDGPTQAIPGLVKLATFFDPDGNHLMLSESLGTEPPAN